MDKTIEAPLSAEVIFDDGFSSETLLGSCCCCCTAAVSEVNDENGDI